MKRCDRERRLYLARIAKNRGRRANRHRKKNKASKPPAKSIAGFYALSAPDVFTLFESRHRSRLLKFLRSLRELTALDGTSVCIDFSQTRRMIVDGALLFAAELERLLMVLGQQTKVRCIPSRNNRVNQVLQRIGIFELLGYKSDIEPSAADVVSWRVAKGAGAQGEKYNEILGPYDGAISKALQQGMYVGLTEAMINVTHHAYIAHRNDGLDSDAGNGGWWMFSQEKDGELAVAFCDLGIGIPGSLPRTQPKLMQRILSLLGSSPRDATLIREAIEHSKSRTGLPYRGRGLKDLVSAIDSVNEGSMILFSNRGCYIVNRKDGTTVRSEHNFPRSILGTLIAWKVSLNQDGDIDAA